MSTAGSSAVASYASSSAAVPPARPVPTVLPASRRIGPVLTLLPGSRIERLFRHLLVIAGANVCSADSPPRSLRSAISAARARRTSSLAAHSPISRLILEPRSTFGSPSASGPLAPFWSPGPPSALAGAAQLRA